MRNMTIGALAALLIVLLVSAAPQQSDYDNMTLKEALIEIDAAFKEVEERVDEIEHALGVYKVGEGRPDPTPSAGGPNVPKAPGNAF